MTIVAARNAPSHSTIVAEATRQRTRELLRSEINFIANAQFTMDAELADPLVDETLGRAGQVTPADSLSPMHRMCESELLTQEQETALFRQMNFLKYRASELRSQLDADLPDADTVAAIDSLLAESDSIRNHIVIANTRLVVSIVKKFVTPELSFDEMLSDGVVTLMQAAEKFDYDRGFRFSTYAYRSIVRNVYRSVTSLRDEAARFTRDAEQWAFEQDDDRSSSLDDQKWSNLRETTKSMLNKLDRRERFIIRSRYALGFHRKVRTFQSLADKLGISKERVRQLEQRAVAKLNAMAGELDLDELTGASLS